MWGRALWVHTQLVLLDTWSQDDTVWVLRRQMARLIRAECQTALLWHIINSCNIWMFIWTRSQNIREQNEAAGTNSVLDWENLSMVYSDMFLWLYKVDVHVTTSSKHSWLFRSVNTLCQVTKNFMTSGLSVSLWNRCWWGSSDWDRGIGTDFKRCF